MLNHSKAKRIFDFIMEVEDEDDDEEEEDNYSKSFYRIVDLDERGSYRAHIEDKNGKVIFSYSNEEEVYDDDGEPTGETEEGELSLVRDGYMKHVDDLRGLEEYLKDTGFIPKDASLREGEGGRSRGGRH